MSTLSHLSTNFMFSLRVLTISSSLVFLAMLLKLSLPLLPTLNVVASWLKPPYLYLVINCIIITIVATSKLQSKFDHYAFPPPPPPSPVSTKPDDEVAAAAAFDHFSFSPPPVRVYGGGGGVGKSGDLVSTVATETSTWTSPLFDNYGYNGPEKVSNLSVHGNVEVEVEVEVEDRVSEDGNINLIPNELEDAKTDARVFESKERVVAKKYEDSGADVRVFENKERVVAKKYGDSGADENTYVKVMNLTTKKAISRAPVLESSKPPASSRFGHRKVVKTTSDHQGGKTLKVSKPKRHETLESTWKTITDGRPMPLTRHLRKSDTWENHPAHTTNAMDLDQDHHKKTKSETFNDLSIRKKNSSMLSRSSGSGGKLKKDPSLGQEELNKRVEAFITKFNEDMRLQRQESLNQYMEMINRGAGP